VRKQNSRKSRFWIFGRTFCKTFSTRFVFQKVFCCVFELPSLKNTRKRDKTKEVEEKLTSIFLSKFWIVFDMDFMLPSLLHGLCPERSCSPRECLWSALSPKARNPRSDQKFALVFAPVLLESRSWPGLHLDAPHT
jgi:hypothetical protein